MINFVKSKILFVLLFLCVFINANGQSGLCTGETPFYDVDLVGDPGGTWISQPPIVRDGSCCGSSFPARCIEFSILLDSNTVAINFEIVSGAVPGGAMYYKIGCGPPRKVGDPICVNGPGPHALTFCKPGSNLNTYAITAIPAPGTSPDSRTSEGCNTKIGTVGLLNDITWRDLTGGGIYDAYLDCTSGCDTVTVTPQAGYPAFVDYEVCGTPAGGPCSPITHYCDTVRVNFVPPLKDSIFPNPAQFCQNIGGIDITSLALGGQAPYTYSWTDPNGTYVGSTQTIYANVEGDYVVEIHDALYPNCPAKFVTGNVSMVLSPTVDAGITINACASNPNVSLTGAEQNTTGIQWNGSGGFDDNTSLTPLYNPTQAEIDAGEAMVYITGVGLGNCEPAIDSVVIILKEPVEITIVGDNLICEGSIQDLEVEITGGNPLYSIVWDNLVTDTINPGLGTGTFSVTVTDQSANTCSDTETMIVTEGPEIFSDLDSLTQIFCNNTSSVTVSASGGTVTSYTYQWNTGEAGQTITVSPGEFIVTITDGAGCSKNDTTLVEATNSTLDFTFPLLDNACYGTSTSISSTVTGGFTPVTYLWDDGNTDSIRSLPAGDYCLEVKDNLGCVVNKCITVIEDSIVVVGISGPSVICKDSTSVMSSWVGGGQAPYTYAWQDGSTSSTFTGDAGSYSLTVTDNNPNGCAATANFTLNESTELLASISSGAIKCPGSMDGSLLVAGSGSEGGYTYLWNDGINTASNSGLDTGWHYVTITDQIGCTALDSAYLVSPDTIEISINGIQNVSCYGLTNGQATVSAIGGTGVYTYSWTGGETTSSAIGLDAGTITVTVTDGNACVMTEELEITEPQALTAGTSEIENLTCYQSGDGSFEINASGGTRPYSYTWTPNVSVDSIGINLSAGNYQIDVIDALGCSFLVNQVIGEPAVLSSVVTLNNDVLCYGDASGSASISIVGGTSPYDLTWSNGEILATNNALDSGMHYVSYSDANNCPLVDSILIGQPDELLVLSSPDGYINCDSTAKVYVDATGGVLPYTYQWSTGGTTDSTIVNNSGNYLIVVTDANACREVDTINIYPLNSTLLVGINGLSHVCNKSSTTITSFVTPGIPPFTYLWDDGSTGLSLVSTGGLHTVTVSDSVGCVFTASKEVIEDAELITSVIQDSVCYGASNSTKVNITGGLAPFIHTWSSGLIGSPVDLIAGDYDVFTLDSTGCRDTTSVSIIENGPYDLLVDKTGNVSCFGLDDGWVRAQVIGGFSPFTYSWLDSNDDSFERFDLSASTYTIVVEDIIGCVDTLPITINEPDSVLKVDVLTEDITCFNAGNGTALATPNGGYAPYTYLWWETNTTGNNLSGLTPGTYNLSVLDSGGCVVNTSISITEPDLLKGFTNVTNVDCYGNASGVAIGSVIGGTSPFEIDWSNGVLDTSKTQGLLSGGYNMYIKDANNCMDTVSFTILQPDSLSLELNKVNVNCFNEASGSLEAVVSGGTPIYSYVWTNSAVIADNLTTITKGIYGVTVTDSKGCEIIRTTSISEPEELLINVESTDPLCFNSCDGSITVDVTGGVRPYLNNIGKGDVLDSIFNDMCPWNYTVITTDANGCQVFELQVPVVAPDTFKIVSTSKTDLLCKEICDGTVEVASNGVSTFSLVPGTGYGLDSVFTALCDGIYDVYIKNENGCVDSMKQVTLTSPPVITFSAPGDTTICVDGVAEFNLNASGGFGALKYYVNGNDTNITGDFSFAVLKDTILDFTIIDENGCSPLLPIVATVNVNDSLTVKAFDDFTICAQDSALVYAQGSGGDGYLSYTWTDGAGATEITDSLIVKPLTTTTYAVVLSDGCESPEVIDSVTIIVLGYPNFTINQSAVNYCIPSQIDFWLISNELTDYDVSWEFNDVEVSDAISDSIEIFVADNYDLVLKLTSPQGCNFIFREDSFITTKPYPVADFIKDASVKKITDAYFEFTNLSFNYDSLEWVIDKDKLFYGEKIISHFDSVKCYPVQLVAYSDAGCSDTIIDEVCVEDVFQVFIPNGFTPNDDGVNDGFIPTVRNIDESTFNFWVFDRWGEQIYHTKNPQAGWNGRRDNTMRDAQIDVYVWVFEATDNWGKHQYEVGTISLIR